MTAAARGSYRQHGKRVATCSRAYLRGRYEVPATITLAYERTHWLTRTTRTSSVQGHRRTRLHLPWTEHTCPASHRAIIIAMVNSIYVALSRCASGRKLAGQTPFAPAVPLTCRNRIPSQTRHHWYSCRSAYRPGDDIYGTVCLQVDDPIERASLTLTVSHTCP